MPIDAAVLVAEDALGVLQQVEDDAFFLGVAHFLDARGHLGLGPAVDQVHLLGAEPQRRAGGIHGHVAAAEHGGDLGVDDGRVGAAPVVGAHQVGARQVLVGREDARPGSRPRCS